MVRESRWMLHRLTCPEGRGETELLLEWRLQGKGEELRGVSCKNPRLRDLSGEECRWSCWEEIIREKK